MSDLPAASVAQLPLAAAQELSGHYCKHEDRSKLDAPRPVPGNEQVAQGPGRNRQHHAKHTQTSELPLDLGRQGR